LKVICERLRKRCDAWDLIASWQGANG